MNILKLYIIKGAQSGCIVLNNQSPFYSPNSKTVLATGMLLGGLDQHGFLQPFQLSLWYGRVEESFISVFVCVRSDQTSPETRALCKLRLARGKV